MSRLGDSAGYGRGKGRKKMGCLGLGGFGWERAMVRKASVHGSGRVFMHWVGFWSCKWVCVRVSEKATKDISRKRGERREERSLEADMRSLHQSTFFEENLEISNQNLDTRSRVNKSWIDRTHKLAHTRFGAHEGLGRCGITVKKVSASHLKNARSGG